MGLVIVSIMAVISSLVSIFIIVRKQSKGDIRLQVEAICEGKNELDQAIMRIYFTFSIGKLANKRKAIIGQKAGCLLATI